MKDKIKELLGNNIPNNIVATAVGCDESYISQLLSDPHFAQEVAELRILNTTAHVTRDKTYDSIEDRLIEKLQDLLDNGLTFTKPAEILAAIRTINSAKRRATGMEFNREAGSRTVVKLQLPSSGAFAAKFIVNNQNQVLEIAGRSVATMPAAGVVKKLEDMQKNAALNKDLHKKDLEEAEVRMEGLVRMEELPVADLL